MRVPQYVDVPVPVAVQVQKFVDVRVPIDVPQEVVRYRLWTRKAVKGMRMNLFGSTMNTLSV